ncbi:MAG: exodeoxyribonuclease VII small subunit [Candidatus Riflebacteria bacterium]|nr:exodeoxyribonuclease VII small subunit [Candidatus Riflebacteria bacterium]
MAQNSQLENLLKITDEALADMSYETAAANLEKTVGLLEKEGTPLETSLNLYTLGIKFADRCKKLLDETEEKMLQLLGTTENPSEKDFNIEKDGR